MNKKKVLRNTVCREELVPVLYLPLSTSGIEQIIQSNFKVAVLIRKDIYHATVIVNSRRGKTIPKCRRAKKNHTGCENSPVCSDGKL